MKDSSGAKDRALIRTRCLFWQCGSIWVTGPRIDQSRATLFLELLLHRRSSFFSLLIRCHREKVGGWVPIVGNCRLQITFLLLQLIAVEVLLSWFYVVFAVEHAQVLVQRGVTCCLNIVCNWLLLLLVLLTHKLRQLLSSGERCIACRLHSLRWAAFNGAEIWQFLCRSRIDLVLVWVRFKIVFIQPILFC